MSEADPPIEADLPAEAEAEAEAEVSETQPKKAKGPQQESLNPWNAAQYEGRHSYCLAVREAALRGIACSRAKGERILDLEPAARGS